MRSKHWPTLGLFGLALLLGAFTWLRPSGDPAAQALGTLPVLHGARVKPWDSLARETLLQLYGKQHFRTEDGQRWTASQWLGEALFDPQRAHTRPVFRVDAVEILAMLGQSDPAVRFVSYSVLKPHLAQIETQARLSHPDSKQRDSFQNAVISLHNRLILYRQLTHSLYLALDEHPDAYAQELEAWLGASPAKPQPDFTPRIQQQLGRLQAQAAVRWVPPFHPEDSWQRLIDVWLAPHPDPGNADLIRLYFNAAEVWRQSGPHASLAPLLELQSQLQETVLSEKQQPLRFEYHFNRLQPFLLSLGLYLLAFVAVWFAWCVPSPSTLKGTWYLLLFVFALHSASIVARMWLTGRPPVTNLYASAVFVGWGSVGLGLLLEWIYRNGIGSIVAATTGCLSLIVAQHLLDLGDPLGQIPAVLDSNFWLATHVMTITLGYAACFAAGFIGALFLLLGVCSRRLTPALVQTMERMVFGIVCFALWFSFVGTFLGGIWADQSWGRFWGWDPKENGALLVVLWNAVLLHAKHAGQIHTVGLMQGAVIGNGVTAWSWFGTNLLGTGLHAYGFMDSAAHGLLGFVCLQLAILALGWIPQPYWRSGPLLRGETPPNPTTPLKASVDPFF